MDSYSKVLYLIVYRLSICEFHSTVLELICNFSEWIQFVFHLNSNSWTPILCGKLVCAHHIYNLHVYINNTKIHTSYVNAAIIFVYWAITLTKQNLILLLLLYGINSQ